MMGTDGSGAGDSDGGESPGSGPGFCGGGESDSGGGGEDGGADGGPSGGGGSVIGGVVPGGGITGPVPGPGGRSGARRRLLRFGWALSEPAAGCSAEAGGATDRTNVATTSGVSRETARGAVRWDRAGAFLPFAVGASADCVAGTMLRVMPLPAPRRSTRSLSPLSRSRLAGRISRLASASTSDTALAVYGPADSSKPRTAVRPYVRMSPEIRLLLGNDPVGGGSQKIDLPTC
jgi:hypothetical protein